MSRSFILPVVLVVAVLSGCTPTPDAPDADPTSEPSHVPSPSPTPTRQPVAAPEPLLDISCAEIAPDSVISPISKHAIALSDVDEPEVSLYAVYPVLAVQGDYCRWTNGTDSNTPDGRSNPAHSGLSISYTPDSEDSWKKYDDIYGPHDASIPENCSVNQGKTSSYCGWSGLAGTTWVDIRFDGLTYFGSKAVTGRKFMTLVNAVKENVAAAPRGETWQPPADVLPLSTSCPGAVSTSAFETAFDLKPSSVKFFEGPIGGTGIEFESGLTIGWDPCFMTNTDFNTEYGIPVYSWHAGEWAWLDARDRSDEFVNAKQRDVAGLADGDTAWTRSTEYGVSLDLLIGGNWIWIPIMNETFTSTKVDAQTALDTLATEIVSTVYDS